MLAPPPPLAIGDKHVTQLGGAARESGQCGREWRPAACLGFQLQCTVAYSAGIVFRAHTRANSSASVFSSLLADHLPAAHERAQLCVDTRFVDMVMRSS